MIDILYMVTKKKCGAGPFLLCSIWQLNKCIYVCMLSRIRKTMLCWLFIHG